MCGIVLTGAVCPKCCDTSSRESFRKLLLFVVVCVVVSVVVAVVMAEDDDDDDDEEDGDAISILSNMNSITIVYNGHARRHWQHIRARVWIMILSIIFVVCVSVYRIVVYYMLSAFCFRSPIGSMLFTHTHNRTRPKRFSNSISIFCTQTEKITKLTLFSIYTCVATILMQLSFSLFLLDKSQSIVLFHTFRSQS